MSAGAWTGRRLEESAAAGKSRRPEGAGRAAMERKRWERSAGPRRRCPGPGREPWVALPCVGAGRRRPVGGRPSRPRLALQVEVAGGRRAVGTGWYLWESAL